MGERDIVVITAAVFFLLGYLMAWRDYRRAVRKFARNTALDANGTTAFDQENQIDGPDMVGDSIN